MKVGYPCINRGIGCTANATFRLASYSEARFLQAVQNNLACLRKILEYNVQNGFLFFRISSDLIPFASHPICSVPWANHFIQTFQEIGRFIRKEGIRISMHPDQFVLINALREDLVEKSIKELEYHAEVLDVMGLDRSAKIQIHVGGVYGDKPKSMSRFVQRYHSLKNSLRKRLVIENDDRLFSLKDCMALHDETGVPVLLDTFHHEFLHNGEDLRESLELTARTWKKKDGVPMVDYSLQEKGQRAGAHAKTLHLPTFKKFIEMTRGFDFDLMLEIKDKEKSALKAHKCLATMGLS